MTRPARWRGARVAVITALVTAGCEDPTEPAIRESGARVTVDVLIPARFASDSVRTAFVSAWMTPGRDAQGGLRRVDAPLRVSGQPIELTIAARSDWATVQSMVVPLSAVFGEGTFAITAPVIAGVQPTISLATLGTARLAEPDTVRISADGALRLHPGLATGGDSDNHPVFRQWTLSVTGTSSLSFTAMGLPPLEIVVPRELLPPPMADGWRVQLNVNETHGPAIPPEPGGEYEVSIRFAQILFRIALPAAAGPAAPQLRAWTSLGRREGRRPRRGSSPCTPPARRGERPVRSSCRP